MQSENFKNTSTEELKSNLTMLKAISIALSAIAVLLIAICVYGLVTKDNNATFLALLAVGFCCLSMLPIQLINLKKIKAELQLREKE